MESEKNYFDNLFENLLIKVKDVIGDATNTTTFVIEAMKIVRDNCKDLHGFEKKDLVMDLLYKIVERMPVEEEDRQHLLDNVVPSMENFIEMICNAAKGYLIIKERVEEAAENQRACCTGLFRRLRPSESNKPKGAAATKKIFLRATEEDAVNMIYDRIRESVVNKHITISNIFIIVSSTMKIVEEFGGFTGAQKKTLVITVIKKVIREIPNITDEDRMAIDLVVDTTVDKAIDYIVAAANGELEILKQVEAIVDKCCPNGCCAR